MRYCEDYVITCTIEVWRGNENARVEYKRGEIGNVTVGGIDAPERLAEVMQWASGNYRLHVPPLELPAVAPEAAAGRRRGARPGPGPGAVGAGRPPVERHQDHLRHAGGGDRQGARRRRGREGRRRGHVRTDAVADHHGHATAGRQRRAGAGRSAASRRRADADAGQDHASGRRPEPGARARRAPVRRSSATKTIFGVPTPGAGPRRLHAGDPAERHPGPVGGRRVGRRLLPPPTNRGKTGARKVAVPGPEVLAAPESAADDPAATRSGIPRRPPRRPSARRRPCPWQDPLRARHRRRRPPLEPIGSPAQAGNADLDLRRRRLRVRPGAARHLPAGRPALPLSVLCRDPQTSTAARASRTTSSGTGSSRVRWRPCSSCRSRAPASRPTR